MDYVFLLLIILLVIILFYLINVLLAKFICFILNKKCKNEVKINAYSINISLICLSITIKNLIICIKDIGHIEIEDVFLTLNPFTRAKKTAKSSNKDLSSKLNDFIIKSKSFYLRLNNINLFTINNSVSNISRSLLLMNFDLNQIKNFMDRIIIDANFLVISINNIYYNHAICLKINRVLLLNNDFVQAKDKLNNFILKPINYSSSELKKSDQQDKIIKSILVNVFKLNITFQKIDKSCIIKLADINYLKLQIYQNNLPKYKLINIYNDNYKIDREFNPSLMIDALIKDGMTIDLDLWNELILLFFSNCNFFNQNNSTECHLIKFKISQFKLNLIKSNEKLFDFTFGNKSKLELFFFSNQAYFNLDLKDILFTSLISYNNKFSFQTNLINISARKLEDDVHEIHVTSKEKVIFSFSNIIPNLYLLSLLHNQLCLISIDVKFNLLLNINDFFIKLQITDSSPNILVLHAESLVLNVKSDCFINKKKAKASIILLSNFSFYNLESNLKCKAERIVVESTFDQTEDKIQLITSPLILDNYLNFNKLKNTKSIFLDENITKNTLIPSTFDNQVSSCTYNSFESYLYSFTVNENKSINSVDLNPKTKNILITENTLYVTVIQFRYQSLKNSVLNYSNQYEILIGDFFGSIDYNNMISLVNLVNSLSLFVKQEIELKNLLSIFENKFSFNSLLIKSSLSQINFCYTLENRYLSNKIRKIIANITMSPLELSVSNLIDKKFKLTNELRIREIDLKLLCSFEDDNRLNLNLYEVGSFLFKMLSYSLYLNRSNKNNNADLIEFLKTSDFKSKNLIFLWHKDELNQINNAKRVNFLLDSFHQEQDDDDFVLKPCLYDSNYSNFGQSILVEKELTFFSYRTFIKNLNKIKFKLDLNNPFIVLSNIENDKQDFKSKFESYEINVYDIELNKFITDNLYNSFDSNKLENHAFEMTQISPPYFSNEFTIYVKYLPLIRFRSDTTFYSDLYPVNKFKSNSSLISNEQTNLKTYSNILNKNESIISFISNVYGQSTNSKSNLTLHEQNHFDSIVRNLRQYKLNLTQIYFENENQSNDAKIYIQEVYVQSINQTNQVNGAHFNEISMKKISQKKEQNYTFQLSQIFIYLDQISLECINIFLESNQFKMREIFHHSNKSYYFTDTYIYVLKSDETKLIKNKLDKLIIEHKSNDKNINISISCDNLMIEEKLLEDSNLFNQLKQIYNHLNEYFTEIRINKTVNLKMTNSVLFNLPIDQFDMAINETIGLKSKEKSISIQNFKSAMPIKLTQLNDFIENKYFLSIFSLFTNRSCISNSILQKFSMKNLDFFIELKKTNHKSILLHLNAYDNDCEYLLQQNTLKSELITAFKFIFMLDVYVNDFSTRQRILTSEFKIVKKLLDTRLGIYVEFDSNKFENFIFNFTFPLAFKSNANNCLIDNFIQIEIPVILAHFEMGDSKEIYELFEINSLNFKLDKNEILFNFDKLRLLKSYIEYDFFNILSDQVRLDDLEECDSGKSKYKNLKIEINQLILCYFPVSLNKRTWIFTKLSMVKIDYIIYDKDNIELNINIENSNNKDDSNKHETEPKSLTKDKQSNISLLITSSSPKIFNKFEFNKWLNYFCLDNSLDDYNFELLSFLGDQLTIKFKLNFIDDQIVSCLMDFNSKNNPKKITIFKNNLKELIFIKFNRSFSHIMIHNIQINLNDIQLCDIDGKKLIANDLFVYDNITHNFMASLFYNIFKIRTIKSLANTNTLLMAKK